MKKIIKERRDENESNNAAFNKWKGGKTMKRLIVVFMAMVFLAMAGGAMAGGSNTLTVTASVTGTCKFSSGTSTLNFGSLDPSLGTNVNGNTTTQFWCTKGVTTDDITPGNGGHWDGSKRNMLDSVSTDLIPYTLTLTKDGNPNAGPSAPRTLTINGTILGSDYTGKSAGSYSDEVTLTINP
ncbi:MAG TPA: hypothetical protein DDW17_08065 [Deltaproteobacteria bacterium]|nr:hypothetical protein [Deltaproteobacteria bacterium]